LKEKDKLVIRKRKKIRRKTFIEKTLKKINDDIDELNIIDNQNMGPTDLSLDLD
jgi:hypothetical protein